jgi:hypothetical protein
MVSPKLVARPVTILPHQQDFLVTQTFIALKLCKTVMAQFQDGMCTQTPILRLYFLMIRIVAIHSIYYQLILFQHLQLQLCKATVQPLPGAVPMPPRV